MKKVSKLESVLWNIALPGFSQLLGGSYIKAIVFISLEFIINANSNFNEAIRYSFLWEIEKAFEVTNFGWLLFYPCVYMFALWDGYRSAMPKEEQFSYLPFVFGAYFVTVGLFYSRQFSVFGIVPGPVFTPMLFLLPGLAVGFLIRFILLSSVYSHK